MDFDDDDLPAGYPNPWGGFVEHLKLHGAQKAKARMGGQRAYPPGEKPARDWNSPAHLRAARKYHRIKHADLTWRAKRNSERRARYAAGKAKKR